MKKSSLLKMKNLPATEEMLAAGDSAIPCAEEDADGFRMMGREVALAAWQAMVDAAIHHTTDAERK